MGSWNGTDVLGGLPIRSGDKVKAFIIQNASELPETVILAYPKDAPKMRYLDYLARENGIEVFHDLKWACERAIEMTEELMHTSDDMTEEFSLNFEDWDKPPLQVDLSDKVGSITLNHPDEAYDMVCSMERPNFYSLTKEQDNCKTWYIFRYEE